MVKSRLFLVLGTLILPLPANADESEDLVRYDASFDPEKMERDLRGFLTAKTEPKKSSSSANRPGSPP